MGTNAKEESLHQQYKEAFKLCQKQRLAFNQTLPLVTAKT